MAKIFPCQVTKYAEHTGILLIQQVQLRKREYQSTIQKHGKREKLVPVLKSAAPTIKRA